MISFSPASSAALRSRLFASAMAAAVTRYFLAMDASVSPLSTRWRRQLTHLSGGISAISAENFCAVPSGRRNSNEGSSGVARRRSEGLSERSVSMSTSMVSATSRKSMARPGFTTSVSTGASDALLHVARAAVVSGHRQIPVAVELVEIAKMLRSGVRGLFGILAFVNPPGVAEPIFMAAVGHELPDPPRPGARKSQRLEGAFGLRQVDQILRQALFLQNAGNHLAITSGAAQSGFHDGASARRLKKIEKGEYLVVDGQRQVVGNVFGRLLRPFFQPWINGKSHLRHFVNRRGNRGSLAEALSGPEGLQFVRIHRIDHTVKQLA